MSVWSSICNRLLIGWHRKLAIKHLRKLERLIRHAEYRCSIPFVYRARGLFKMIRPMQDMREIDGLYQHVLELRPLTVLEVGTARGGTLYLWTQAAADDATIVSIDLPGGKFGGGYHSARTWLYQQFAKPTQSIHLLRADSHATQTADRVREIFGGRQIDFLFIDADHTYEGVKQDFLQYSKLVRPGGVIAFHDIRQTPHCPETRVHVLWEQIKQQCQVVEFVNDVDEPSIYGIGMIKVPNDGLPEWDLQ